MARTVLFRGAATVHTSGISSDTINVVTLTIENGAASGVSVEVQALMMAPAYPNQPMANPAEVRTATAMPTGGTVLTKNRILGLGSSDANVVVRGARTAADAASAITATGTQARVGFVAHSKHIQSGNQQGILSNQALLTQPVVLKPGEALVVTQLPDWVAPLATANHRTFYDIVWEEFSETAGPQTIAVGQVTETDTAGAITARKTKVVGQVSETDVAQALVVRKTRAVGQVVETDLAQVLQIRPIRVPVGQVVETDLAQPIGHSKRKTIGQALETDLAQPITVKTTRLVGRVTETDLAQPISRAAGGGPAAGKHHAGWRRGVKQPTVGSSGSGGVSG